MIINSNQPTFWLLWRRNWKEQSGHANNSWEATAVVQERECHGEVRINQGRWTDSGEMDMLGSWVSFPQKQTLRRGFEFK